MNILDNISNNIILYLMCLIILIVLIIILIKLKPKKVKPIEFTIDDEEKSDIEKVIESMEETNERKMTTFEEEQEANAIISYQELVKAVGDKKSAAAKEPEEMTEAQMNLVDEIEKINEGRNRIDSNTLENDLEDDLEEMIETQEIDKDVEEEKAEEKKETPKFKKSEFISPVFGKDNNNDNFLKELKDFRDKL